MQKVRFINLITNTTLYSRGPIKFKNWLLVLNFNNFSIPIKGAFSSFPHGTSSLSVIHTYLRLKRRSF